MVQTGLKEMRVRDTESGYGNKYKKTEERKTEEKTDIVRTKNKTK